MFITFEGGEGGGKTTQINRLSDWLSKQGRRVLTTREPGGTPEAESVRNLLVKGDGGNWSAEAEVLMVYAARVMHVERVIKPALSDEKIVICDRFSDSTRVYQGYGRGHPLDAIDTLDAMVLKGFEPDMTFVLDVDPKIGVERSLRRMATDQAGFFRQEDRFEKLDAAFHEKVRQGFLTLAKAAPNRCHVIDASQSLRTVTEDIRKHVAERLTR